MNYDKFKKVSSTAGNFKIWQPRYKDNKVLLSKKCLSEGWNMVEFTEAKHLLGKKFKVHSDTVKKCSVCTNGKILCYEVPMENLIEIAGEN